MHLCPFCSRRTINLLDDDADDDDDDDQDITARQAYFTSLFKTRQPTATLVQCPPVNHVQYGLAVVDLRLEYRDYL